MGLRRDIDLALHLPLRYEDETRITLASARDGQTVQIEATVTACECSCACAPPVAGAGGRRHGQLRAAVFLPSHQKTMAVGNRLRIRGARSGGFWGGRCCTRRSGWRGRITRCPHARLPHHRRAAPALSAARRGQRPGAGGPIRHPAAGVEPPHAIYGSKWPPALVGFARGALLHHPTPDVALSTLEDHSHPPGSA